MLSIISPAKSLNFEKENKEISHTLPILTDKSQQVVNVLNKLDLKQFMKLMSISENLAQLNVDRIANWKLPFTLKNSKQAVFAFTGDVYVGLNANEFTKDDLSYSQSSLRILSGLYGLLKPLDLIQAYRLEMGTKISVVNSKNLYDFWKEDITRTLNEDLKVHQHNYLLNLASNEYFKVIDKQKINADIINPVFKNYKNGEYKVISFFAKKARGLMAAYQIKNKVKTLDDIKSFNSDGYYFSPEMSENNSLVFLRDVQ